MAMMPSHSEALINLSEQDQHSKLIPGFVSKSNLQSLESSRIESQERKSRQTHSSNLKVNQNWAFTTKNDLVYNNPRESGQLVKIAPRLNDFKLTRCNRLRKDTREQKNRSELSHAKRGASRSSSLSSAMQEDEEALKVMHQGYKT